MLIILAILVVVLIAVLYETQKEHFGCSGCTDRRSASCAKLSADQCNPNRTEYPIHLPNPDYRSDIYLDDDSLSQYDLPNSPCPKCYQQIKLGQN